MREDSRLQGGYVCVCVRVRMCTHTHSWGWGREMKWKWKKTKPRLMCPLVWEAIERGRCLCI